MFGTMVRTSLVLVVSSIEDMSYLLECLWQHQPQGIHKVQMQTAQTRLEGMGNNRDRQRLYLDS